MLNTRSVLVKNYVDLWYATFIAEMFDTLFYKVVYWIFFEKARF